MDRLMDRGEELYACAVRHDRWDIAQGWVDHEQVDTVGTSTAWSGPG